VGSDPQVGSAVFYGHGGIIEQTEKKSDLGQDERDRESHAAKRDKQPGFIVK
jgi:hypothetical protein